MKKGAWVLALLVIGGWCGVASAADNWLEPVTGMEFVKVGGGCFQMGQDPGEKEELALLLGSQGAEIAFGDELPQHEVCVDDFNMARYEVTAGAFRKSIEAAGYRAEADEPGCQEYPIPRYRWQENRKLNSSSPGFSQKDNEPVVCVSWNDAVAFAAWLSKNNPGRNFRLATEAEWEFAARDRGKIKTYGAGGSLDLVGWYVKNSPRRTSPVGKLQSGELEIYDLHGNVWEWVGDYYAWDFYGRSGKDNPTGPEQGLFRTMRGGGWNSFAWNCRAAKRDRALAGHRDTNLGFRLVYTEGR